MMKKPFSPFVIASVLIWIVGLALILFAFLEPIGSGRVGVIASILVAIGTLQLALVSYWQTKQLRSQFAESQQSALRLFTESQHSSLRPILIPHGSLPKKDLWNQSDFKLFIANAGGGVATNILGVLLPPEEERNVLPQQFFMRMLTPLAASHSLGTIFHIGGTKLSYTHTISGYSFCVPRKHKPARELRDIYSVEDPRLARLTLTYVDVFGDKHASIWDMSTSGAWVEVAILQNILKDIYDIDS
jgi:hypothetical protein